MISASLTQVLSICRTHVVSTIDLWRRDIAIRIIGSRLPLRRELADRVMPKHNGKALLIHTALTNLVLDGSNSHGRIFPGGLTMAAFQKMLASNPIFITTDDPAALTMFDPLRRMSCCLDHACGRVVDITREGDAVVVHWTWLNTRYVDAYVLFESGTELALSSFGLAVVGTDGRVQTFWPIGFCLHSAAAPSA